MNIRQRIRIMLVGVVGGSPDAVLPLTVGDYLDEWLATTVASNRRPSTVRSYCYVINTFVAPALGPIPLTALTPLQVQMLVTGMAGTVSPPTVRLCLRVLRAALNQAVRWGYIRESPAQWVDGPRGGSKRPMPMTSEEAGRFLDAAHGERLEALFILAVTMGPRRGELLGLTWGCVDSRTSTMRIEAQWVGGTPVPRRGEPLVLSPLKSESSERAIGIPPFVMSELQLHRGRQEEEALQLGTRAWRDYGLVFPNGRGGPLSEASLFAAYRRVLDRAGIPRRRFHDLRHTAGSIMVEQGVDIRIVQATLGHSDLAQTMLYTHVSPTAQATAATAMQRLLGERGSTH